MTSTFWQITFLGAVGTITGSLGLYLNWLSHNYNTPKIEIDKLLLVIPNYKHYQVKTLQELQSSYMRYDLEIVVRNKRGGSGSIDKPELIIKIPTGKKFYLFKTWREIVFEPATAHQESRKIDANMTEFWTVRHGRAFNLGGGEKADDTLAYSTYEAQEIYDLTRNSEQLEYWIRYTDNNGKKFTQKIIKTIVDR